MMFGNLSLQLQPFDFIAMAAAPVGTFFLAAYVTNERMGSGYTQTVRPTHKDALIAFSFTENTTVQYDANGFIIEGSLHPPYTGFLPFVRHGGKGHCGRCGRSTIGGSPRRSVVHYSVMLCHKCAVSEYKAVANGTPITAPNQIQPIESEAL